MWQPASPYKVSPWLERRRRPRRSSTAPRARLEAIRPDEDAKQLNASLYASQVRSRTLVVTSNQDEAVPAAVGQEVFGLLPPATPKRLIVLGGVAHGRYFLSEEFWRQFAEFFGLGSTAKGPTCG